MQIKISYFFEIKIIMKLILFLFGFIFFSNNLFAQAPAQMNFQFMLRRWEFPKKLLVNDTVSARISILKGGINNNPAIFVETHEVVLDDYGMGHVLVFDGNTTTGNFSEVDWRWTYEKHGLKTEYDFDAGSTYAFINNKNKALDPVPYALHANTADMGFNLTASSTGDTLYISGGNWVIIPGISAANN